MSISKTIGMGGLSAFSLLNFGLYVALVIALIYTFKKAKEWLGFTAVETLDYQQSTVFPKSTITNGQAKDYANRLYEAMRWVGNDEPVIKSIFDKCNLNDLIKVYNYFGFRSYTQNFPIQSDISLSEMIDKEIFMDRELKTYVVTKLKNAGLW